MLKSKRTLRKPIEPVNAELAGTYFEGLTSLSQIGLKLARLNSDITNYRSLGWDLSGYVTNGDAVLAHPRDGSFTISGLDVFDGEPDLTHLSAAITEYAVWLGYWEVLGWSMLQPVTNGIFEWVRPDAIILAMNPVPHDLWVDDTGEGWSESPNIIIAPGPTVTN